MDIINPATNAPTGQQTPGAAAPQPQQQPATAAPQQAPAPALPLAAQQPPAQQEQPAPHPPEVLPQTFTQEDVNRIVGGIRTEMNSRMQTAVREAVTEAQRLAAMSADERAAEERRIADEDYNARLAALNRREMVAEAKGTLESRGLPLSLSACLDYTDAAACKASIDAVEADWRASVQAGVNERLKGSAPATGNSQDMAPPVSDVRASIAHKNAQFRARNQ